MQPSPDVFFQSFFELDFSNMATILCFNSRIVASLLKSDHDKFFEERKQLAHYQPLFYKNKVQKGTEKYRNYFYRSAIEIAYKNNQRGAVDNIIDFIVKFQNHLPSSFLFIDLIPTLIETGIKMKRLFDSSIFCIEFELDEWPSTHTCDDYEIRPYNKTVFQIRKHYKEIFYESKYDPIDLDDEDGMVKKLDQ